MKSKRLSTYISIVFLSIGLYGCSEYEGLSGKGNNLKKGQIEIKVYPNKTDNKVSFNATANKITIDWGDGYIDRLTPNGVEQKLSHEYANQNLQTISIETEKLVDFGISTVARTCKELWFGEMNELEVIRCAEESLTVLKIKKAGALTGLGCAANKLTSLDLRGCTALNELDCSSNQLTSGALNSLFESLPNRSAKKDGEINIESNPGSGECNKTIVENKGWHFWTY